MITFLDHYSKILAMFIRVPACMNALPDKTRFNPETPQLRFGVWGLGFGVWGLGFGGVLALGGGAQGLRFLVRFPSLGPLLWGQPGGFSLLYVPWGVLAMSLRRTGDPKTIEAQHGDRHSTRHCPPPPPRAT